MRFHGPLNGAPKLHQPDSYPFLDPDDPDQERMREKRRELFKELGVEIPEYGVKPSHISDEIWARMQ